VESQRPSLSFGGDHVEDPSLSLTSTIFKRVKPSPPKTQLPLLHFLSFSQLNKQPLERPSMLTNRFFSSGPPDAGQHISIAKGLIRYRWPLVSLLPRLSRWCMPVTRMVRISVWSLQSSNELEAVHARQLQVRQNRSNVLLSIFGGIFRDSASSTRSHRFHAVSSPSTL